MEKFDWVTFITGIFGGGVFVHFLELYNKRGKLSLYETNLKLHYSNMLAKDAFVNFDLDLLFKNTSGHQAIITDITATFFDGKNFKPLRFLKYNIPPAGTIPERNVRCLQFELVLNEYEYQFETVPLKAIYNDKTFVDITYNYKNKKYSTRIAGSKIELDDVTPAGYS